MSTSLSRTLVKLAGVAIAAAASTLALPSAHAEAASGRTFYVSPSGSDANTGTDANHPFQSLGKVSNGFLRAGDTLLLQGGATLNGKLSLWADGTAADRINIGSYGSGKATVTGGCIDLGASYVTIQNLLVTGCDLNGIWVYGSNDVVQNVEATHNVQAIAIDTHAQNTKVLNNNLHNNDRMAPNTPGAFDDFGAIGVVVDGDNTEVAYNHFDNNYAPSADFGVDGSAVEIYGGIGTVVHHNWASNNETFTELGNARSNNTTFAYNLVTSSLRDSEFLITRGSQDYFGPVAGTTATNNTVNLTGANSRGFVCYAGCSPSLFQMSNNVLAVGGRIGDLEGTMGGSNNLYSGGQVTFKMLPGDKVGNPQFQSGGYMPSASSPLVDAGVSTSTKVDLDNKTVGVDGNGDGQAGTDIGAYELNGGDSTGAGNGNGGGHHGHGHHHGHHKHKHKHKDGKGKGKGNKDGKGKGGKGKGHKPHHHR